MAMRCEKSAETFYRYLELRYNRRWVKNVFKYLADTELTHFIYLKTQYTYLSKVENEPEKYFHNFNKIDIILKL